jgi:hypothetical protein
MLGLDLYSSEIASFQVLPDTGSVGCSVELSIGCAVAVVVCSVATG